MVTGLFLATFDTHAAPITTQSLIEEMADLERLATFPDPSYKTVQFSSYDHRSVLPGGPEWFANSDGFGSEPVPNFEAVLRPTEGDTPGEYLICDVEGPGAVVRVWSARMLGTIRMYLDGAETPTFDGPAEDFLMRPYATWGAESGLAPEVFADTFFQRNAAYCPIPFAKRCRIVWEGKLQDTHFYQVQIRLYDEAAEVKTFTPADLAASRDTIARIAGILADPDTKWPYRASKSPETFTVAVEPGKPMVSALELTGPAAIERLTLQVKADNVDDALRQTILHITFDGYPWGQVQAPVGDFFGAAPGINPYTSVPFTVSHDGKMTCRFVMPFESTCRIAFENLGEQPVEVCGEALPVDCAWDPDRSMHFRARWRIDHDLVASGELAQDMPYLVARGAGVYVGSVVFVLNPSEVPTPGGNWWGEGDEKIFVDDDVRPSTFGTGSEDYFNYAWSSPDIFLFPYCGQPRNDGPANRGFVTNFRWHVLDPLPFKSSMAFYMELFDHTLTKDMYYGRIGYHYGRPGLMDEHVTITSEDVRPPRLPRGWRPVAIAGAKNSVFFEAEDAVKGKRNVEIVEGDLWAGGKLCLWKPDQVGDELVLHVTLEKGGKYAVRLACALTPESGAFSLRVNDEDARIGGGVADLYDPYRTLLREISGATLDLKPGEQTLTLRFEGGKGPAENKAIGTDFVWLQKQ